MAKRGLPPNLYERKGYFSWRNPATREEFGLGANRAQAILQAVEANLHIARITTPRLIDRLTGAATRTVQAWSVEYAKALAKVARADNTRRTYASFNRRVVALLGPEKLVEQVTPLDVTAALDSVVAEGKARSAQALRHFMRDWFREATVQGWVKTNPVMDTKLRAKVVVKRSRLSFDQFMALYERANLAWLKNAMALALVTGQRREDISEAKFSAFHADGWKCVQRSEKATNPHKILIPLDLRLDVFGMSVGDVVRQCRKTGIASPYLIHQTEPTGNSPRGSQIWVDTISRRFTEELGKLNIDWAGKNPATFHEIRSLSERLYDAQGGVNTQHLLGHSDPAMTAVYHDTRGSEFVCVLDK